MEKPYRSGRRTNFAVLLPMKTNVRGVRQILRASGRPRARTSTTPLAAQQYHAGTSWRRRRVFHSDREEALALGDAVSRAEVQEVRDARKPFAVQSSETASCLSIRSTADWPQRSSEYDRGSTSRSTQSSRGRKPMHCIDQCNDFRSSKKIRVAGWAILRD